MVNNRATYQRQSYIPEAVAAIIKEHKLYFNPHIISPMFMQDPNNHTTWDVHQADQPNMCDVDQGMCNILKVPITVVSNADITHCEAWWMGQQQH